MCGNPQSSSDAIEALIVPRASDIGGFEVQRALPSKQRQMVGPFIFFDEMGPMEMLNGRSLDVLPHPHIGLATVTYLMSGRLHHRDSLGTQQWITPGDVNLMVAGRGITHSERTDGLSLQGPDALHGVQSWVALPEHLEGVQPTFHHAAAAASPVLADGGAHVRVILGDIFGARADVPTTSEMFYAEAILDSGAKLPLPDNQEDRAVYVLAGSVTVGNDVFQAGRMLVFRPKDALSLQAGPAGARVLLLGGATMNGPRYIWWNFVSSSRERIREAKEAWRATDWENGLFSLPPLDNKAFVPLPVRRG
ncbi:pirin family protein [Donghicola mangrovi]|uniref:Pirin family protein n=1 Tax=Donghicola mangrovi TaxID=2729614 RepID=A0A850Q3L6_9RHOB|nr:pirin family protein [Donghicola mangrovi]NVO23554.1 pirin family protein [Donghicola mangrovi]